MRYMLDTNICVYLIQRHPPQVTARFEDIPVLPFDTDAGEACSPLPRI